MADVVGWTLESYLDTWLGRIFELSNMPGLAVAVAKEGKIIFNQAYGYADLESQERLSPKHYFRIASQSKTFTATAIMQLAQDQKLRIDEPICNYLGWLKNHSDKNYQKVTARQLLSHAAGVIRDGYDSQYWSFGRPFPGREKFINEIMEAPLIIGTNTKFKYSNFGYGLLGLLIEAVSGQTYHEYVTDHIIMPLRLKDTGPEIDKHVQAMHAVGYSRHLPGRKPVQHLNSGALASATGFYSTTADLVKYYTAHLEGNGKLLEDESKKMMQKTEWMTDKGHVTRSYGLGFDIAEFQGRRLIGHGGAYCGYSSQSYIDPADKLAVIVIINATGAGASYLARCVYRVVDFIDRLQPDPVLKKFEGSYMGFWGRDDYLADKGKMFIGDGDSWEPFEEPDLIEHLDGNEFRIKKTGSHSSYGEKVIFAMKDDKVESVNYGGGKMLPAARYLAEMEKITRIEMEDGK